jgi:hypothetical protein
MTLDDVFQIYDLQHYVIFRGEVPPAVERAVLAWLERHGAARIAQRVWQYPAKATVEASRERSQQLNALIQAGIASEGEPRGSGYEILMLGPCGHGSAGWYPSPSDEEYSIGHRE